MVAVTIRVLYLKLLKAIIIGLLYYSVALILDVLGNSIILDYQNFMSYVWWTVSSLVIFLLTRYFYFKKKPKNPLKEGMLLGILLAIITFFIEIPLIVYFYGMGWSIYLFWIVWIQYLLVIFSPIIGAFTK
jgi:hypothetical protein